MSLTDNINLVILRVWRWQAWYTHGSMILLVRCSVHGGVPLSGMELCCLSDLTGYRGEECFTDIEWVLLEAGGPWLYQPQTWDFDLFYLLFYLIVSKHRLIKWISTCKCLAMLGCRLRNDMVVCWHLFNLANSPACFQWDSAGRSAQGRPKRVTTCLPFPLIPK